MANTKDKSTVLFKYQNSTGKNITITLSVDLFFLVLILMRAAMGRL